MAKQAAPNSHSSTKHKRIYCRNNIANEYRIKKKATETPQEISVALLLALTLPPFWLGSRHFEDGSLYSQCGTLVLGSRGCRAHFIHKLLYLSVLTCLGLHEGLTQVLICFASLRTHKGQKSAGTAEKDCTVMKTHSCLEQKITVETRNRLPKAEESQEETLGKQVI